MRLPTANPKIILIVIGSLIVVGGISFGTFTVLRELKPAVLDSLKNKSTDSSAPQLTGPAADLQRAEQLMKAGKLSDAKTAYQTAATGYTTEGNTAAAADATTQIAIIDAMLNSQTTVKQQSSNPHQSGSAQ